MKKGFTLIEMLVTVLLISILIGIAWPSYRLAVGKAVYANVLSGMKIIAESQEAYYLLHGRYSSDIKDIEIPSSGEIKDIYGNMVFYTNGNWTSVTDNMVITQSKKLPYNSFYIAFKNGEYGYRLACVSDDSNSFSEKLCKSLSDNVVFAGSAVSCDSDGNNCEYSKSWSIM